MSEERSRRDLLRTGTLAGAAALGGLAGCVGESGPGGSDGGETPDERTTDTGDGSDDGDGSGEGGGNDGGTGDGVELDGDPGWYADWIPPRSAFGDPEVTENRGPDYVVQDAGPIEDNRDRLTDEEYESAMEAFDADALPGEGEVDRIQMVAVGSVFPIVYVALGEFDVDAVLEEVTEHTDAQGQHRGYEVHSGSPPPTNPVASDVDNVATAVRDDALVFALGAGAPLVKAFVDAGSGEGPRAVEESDAMDRLESTLGPGFGTVGNLAPPPDRIREEFGGESLAAYGESARFVEGVVAVDYALVYDGEVPDTEPVETAAAGSGLENITSRGKDGVMALSGTVDFESYDSPQVEVIEYDPMAGGSDSPPQLRFDFTWDGEQVVITHEVGDTITAENTGESGRCDEPGLGITADGEHLACWPADIAAGDSTTVFPESRQTVRVRWRSVEDGETATLGSFRIPDP